MIALDTNILVRFLVGDDKKQSKIALDIFKNSEDKEEVLFIPLLVVLELIWVLDSVYECERSEIVDSIEQLTMISVLHFEHVEVIHSFIQAGRITKFDLPDLLIAHSAKFNDCEKVKTFDKDVSKYHLFELLEGKQ